MEVGGLSVWSFVTLWGLTILTTIAIIPYDRDIRVKRMENKKGRGGIQGQEVLFQVNNGENDGEK